ncbi:MAG: hypothetical protein IPH81_03280 [Candidatus Microthrix sp.]|nr:hypothetical protein [Candidatus Microthrix sp.]MBK6311695.1 hypothetical protein [Candidatus Microthrix sp.]MBK6437926.1 hypothetical protein [Candidatus Microthrix sp.]MBK6971181.1 hypothetical protein [Candidatus Microthrix sp.]MBK7164326.1 hypothetical protein [Candidatus Microthrix sp.]
MAGKTPQKAVKAFRDPIAEALGCFGPVFVGTTSTELGATSQLTLNGGKVMRLPGSDPLDLDVSIVYRVVSGRDDHPHERSRWKVSTLGWWYSLERDAEELVAYHWHPEVKSDVTDPHLHIGGQDKTHYPTGRIMLEDVLRLAVELGVEPVDQIRWDECYERNRANFALGATWGLPVRSPGPQE